MENKKHRLLGCSLDELRVITSQLGLPNFSAKQIAEWLYVHPVGTIDEMTNLSKRARQLLNEQYTVGLMPPVDAEYSHDGTIKYLFPTESGHTVETVYIPDGDRATLCVSSQVGCKMNCLFCQTGKQGFDGQLTVADILNQIFALPQREQLTNVVYMGQGEPMDNLDAVLRSTEVLTAGWGCQWSPKRITVSSVGIRGKLKRFLDESQCHVAISLHNPFADERQELMPAERGMSINEVVALLSEYDSFSRLSDNSEQNHQRRLTFEYIVFKGVNDSKRHADELLRLLRPLRCRVNLIRFHQIPDVPLQGVADERMIQMRDYLTKNGLVTTIRASRGQDISAACGLLNTAKNNKKP